MIETRFPEGSRAIARPVLWCVGLVVLAAMAGCQKMEQPKTAGQQLDSVIDKTHEVAVKTAEQTRDTLHDVGQRLSDNAPRLQEEARNAGSSVQKTVDDVALTAQVSAGLARDPDLSALRIDVDTRNGAVVLKGPAPTQVAKERAASIAGSVAGVVSVDNQLVVKGG